MLSLDRVTVTYGRRPVLQEVSLTVQPGEVIAIIGPNGAGKSTLVRAASGVQALSSGQVLLDGQDLRTLPSAQRARRISVVPQARQLPEAFSVYQTVLLGRTPYLNWMGAASARDHAAVQRALALTSLDSMAERPVGQLSGGEQQRVLLARSLAQETPVLLLDEPTTHLDLQHQSALLNLVQRLAHHQGLAVGMVLHELNLAGLYADRVALLVDGRFTAVGTPQEVLTAAQLSAVYRVPVNVIRHPEYGTPLVLPDGRLP